jgi:site-specific recombinase XerD
MPLDNEESILTRLTNISSKLYKIIGNADDDATPAEIVSMYKEPARIKPSKLGQVEAEMFAKKLYNEKTRVRMSSGIKQFITFTKNICISKINQGHIENFYNHYLQTQSGYTVDKKVQHIKRLFTYAEKHKYITTSPFIDYQFPALPRLDPIRLTVKEINKIASKRLHVHRLNYIRDMFLFQCYTGFAYKDIFAFSKNMVVKQDGELYLSGSRMKNGQGFFLPFFPEAMAIAEQYNYTFRNISNQKFNSYLKEIATLCRVNKSLSTHVGRKTFGQMMIDRGYTAESVSKMLGHASFDMTQKHYARIGETRIQSEHLKLMEAA